MKKRVARPYRANKIEKRALTRLQNEVWLHMYDNTTENDEHLAAKISKYSTLFLNAWNDLKNDLAEGAINYPANEHELRSFLFSKCLDLMRTRGFDTPYQIHAEDSAIYGKDIADLTLGDLVECEPFARAVTVEI